MAKEEVGAIVQGLHHKKHSPTHGKRDETKVAESKDKQKIPGSPQEKNAKKGNILVRAREEIDAIIHHKSPHRHHRETHGLSDDIDENTPNDEVKGQINSNSVLVALLDSHYMELAEFVEKSMLLQTLEGTASSHNITIFASSNEWEIKARDLMGLEGEPVCIWILGLWFLISALYAVTVA
ncbi:uncharacterized protein LOC114731211 [Neltuma alba]|uniref:uncharacterized protein LOC114731211 n=1 Tax=Neltuma alba TaxID=207710 RepID=UPI0010A3B3F0|nr:uncharacterized protein LOC114731211 [Prosopis alba]